MPYIKQNDRKKFEDSLHVFENFYINCNLKELSFLIYSLCDIYLNKIGECYRSYNTIMGVLTCARNEYLRRNNMSLNLRPLVGSIDFNVILFNDALDAIEEDELIETEGELNYLITSICLIYEKSKQPYILSRTIPDVLSIVANEYYEKEIELYENLKIAENGEVYGK